MKLCLCFHCLCESYDEVPPHEEELFVSVDDMRSMVEKLYARGYKFTSLDDPSPNTVTVTFDDGYHNNTLFDDLSRSLGVPYIVFVSAYYSLSGEPYLWLANSGQNYNQMHNFDYYAHYSNREDEPIPEQVSQLDRPADFDELSSLNSSGLMEVGCHGYYHQPLSEDFEKYLDQELDSSMALIQEKLGVEPRYFALPNGIYTKQVVHRLLKTFDKVLTIDGMPFKTGDRVVHRVNLTNPNISGPLIQQIDKNLIFPRQLRRAFRTKKKMWL